MDRDFQKVLQALTAFDKKLSLLEDVVKQLAEANVNYATSQQELNKEQSELNKDLASGLTKREAYQWLRAAIAGIYLKGDTNNG